MEKITKEDTEGKFSKEMTCNEIQNCTEEIKPSFKEGEECSTEETCISDEKKEMTADGDLDILGVSREDHDGVEQKRKIVLNRVRAVTVKVPVAIEDICVKAVIDTGAEVTVLSEREFNKISEDMRPELSPARE